MPFGEYALLAILLALFFLKSFLPAWRHLNTDFRGYYVVARLYREGSSLRRVYDVAWFQRQKDHAGIEEGFAPYHPSTLLSALPIVSLASLPPLTAKRSWLIINLVLIVACTGLMTRFTRLGWRRIFILFLLAVEPLWTSFLYGQMHLPVLALLTVAVWCALRQQPGGAGLSAALAAGLKLYPALSLLFFLRKKQWRAAIAAMGGFLALAALSLWLFGTAVHWTYLTEVLPHTAHGENVDPYAPQWNSLTAFLHFAFIQEPGLNPHPLFNSPALYATLQPLCQVAIFLPMLWLLFPGKVDKEHEKLEWSAFITMLMALSTHAAPYHLCVLVLAAALALDSLLATGRRRQAWAVLVLYGTTCLPWMRWGSQNSRGWHLFLAAPRIYPLLGLLIVLYYTLYSQPSVRARIATYAREKWGFAGLAVVLVIAGVLQARRHLDAQFDNYAHRFLTLHDSVMAGSPAVGAHGLLFTNVPSRSEHFELWSGSRDHQYAPAMAADEFHPATAPNLPAVWMEITGRVSEIVRCEIAPGATVPACETEVVNGEQPSVSPDGATLAFIREVQGRGALWMKSVAGSNASPHAPERQVVKETYDVWEAAFEPGGHSVVFAAAATGQPELYSLDVTSGEIVPMPVSGAARYPAFSADGRWLAYSRCERGSWHLYIASMPFVTPRRLTRGECNSVSPVWEADSKGVIYATDCGRALQMTTLARIEAFARR